MLKIEDIRERLSEIRPPGMGRDLIALGAVRQVDLTEGVVAIRLALPGLPQAQVQATLAEVRRAVGAFDGVREVRVALVDTPAAPEGPQPLPGVRDIVAVSSAKGGVGKSTVAANLAVALARAGKRVGLLDADVYGPSVPTMFGLSGRPQADANKRLFPPERFGVRVMSVGFFLDDSSPVIWRGPMVMGLVRQFLQDVAWGELDVLLIDLPPGTGDAPLTLVQQVPLAGGVIVTTPQDVATLDVERGIAMFRRVETPILGIVENMSFFACPNCGQHDEVFGAGGAARLAERHAVPLLGSLPLFPEVRQSGDAGTPIVVAQPDHPVSRTFADIANSVLIRIETARAETAAPTIIE